MRLFYLITALVIAAGAPLNADVVLSVTPASQSIASGADTQVQVSISGLGLNTPPSLGAFDLNLAFNPAIVTFTGLTFGDPVKGDQLDLSATGAIGDFSNQPAGTLEFFQVSLNSASLLNSRQADQFVLATLHFQGVAPGFTLLIPSLNSISDAAGNSFAVRLESASLNTIAVPEPTTFWLFAFVAGCIMLRNNLRLKRPRGHTH